MHKQYPYLQNSFLYQTDYEREKRKVLSEIDNFLNQRQYVKITLLNWDEEPIKDIEGEISTGSISKVGDSPIRRTMQLTCAVDARSYSVDDGKADFAINKKIFVEVGVKNETDEYQDYPIFWFPEGVFFIGSFSINSGSNSSTVITLSLKDKMAMLTGDVGGTLPATTIFDSMDTQLPTGEYIEKKVLIYNIIQEAVHHYGGEDLNRIVIEGVPLRIRRIMQWVGDTPLYQTVTAENSNGSDITYSFTTTKPSDDTSYIIYETGDDVGYIMDDFVITDELTGAPGESVTSILDKIKNIIGNYEYFYDVFGVFHFREIKNYYVTTQARTVLDEMAENDYLVEVNNNRSTYTFDDEKLLTSITVTPQYENIKNDYIIEGQTTIGDSNIVYPIRYHLAIDDKPKSLGVDSREYIRYLINNDDKIAQVQQELNQTKARNENSGKALSDLLYKIRLYKNNIVSLQNTIDTLDKNPILKTLQTLFNTQYTYEELNEELQFLCDTTDTDEEIIDWDNLLLSEKWLIREEFAQYITKSTLQTFIESIPGRLVKNNFIEDEEYLNKLQLWKSVYDQAKQLWEADEDNIDLKARYLEAKQQVETLTKQRDQLIEEELNEQYRFAAITQNLLDNLNAIRKNQQNILDKKQLLFGTTEKEDWVANNYDTLVLRDNGTISFSHNIEQFKNEPVNEKNIYKITTQDGAQVTKNLSEDKDELIYKYSDAETQTLSILAEFCELWQTYHDPLKNNELNEQNELQTKLNDLQNNNKHFDYKKNPYKNVSYYDIYPIEQVSNTNVQELIFFKHPRNGNIVGAYVLIVDDLPNVGNFNLIYKQSNIYYYWDGETYQEVDILAAYDNTDEQNMYYAYDWRTKLYLDGLKGTIHGTDQGYYFAELSAYWPMVYDLINQEFYSEQSIKISTTDAENQTKTAAIKASRATSGIYYLDFLDATTTSFGEWSVDNIGRRSDVIVKEEINCLFQPEIPNVILLPAEETALSLIGNTDINETYRYGSSLESQLTLQQLRAEAQRNFYPWTQVSSEIFSKLRTGGYKNGAFDQIKYELYLHTRYQKTISLTSIPVFYLEPNNRITINDTTTNTYGDFVVQSINITLGPGANMSVTCNETLERF